MKFSLSLAIIIIVGLIVNCEAIPIGQRMVYYQPSSRSWYPGPQRLMYLQYQQVRPSKTHSRSTQAAAALVAGDSIATGTYLKDCNNPEDPAAPLEDELNETGANGAQSVAEAYPDQTEFEIPSADNVGPYSFNQKIPSYDGAVENLIPSTPEENQDQIPTRNKIPRDYNYEKGSDSPVKPETVDVPLSEDEIPTEISTITPVLQVKPIRKTPASPAKRYLPAKKKVIVELEQENEEDDDEEETGLDEYDPLPEDRPARVPNAGRQPPTKKGGQSPPAKRPNKGKAPLPAGTFFPIDFGGTSGGAIAIANSFSTGEGGSASSHAIAYGSPEAARARHRPTKFH